MEKTKYGTKKNRIIAYTALIWNLLGVMSFIFSLTNSPSDSNLYNEEQIQVLINMPLWAVIAYCIAVVCGFLGSLALVFKSAKAHSLFLISLFGILIQYFHAYVVENGITIFGYEKLILPLLVLSIGIYLLIHSSKLQRHG